MSDENVKTLSNEFFTDLIKDTEFKLASVGSLMHSRVKVRTPLYVLNDIYGGGLPLGILSEVSGGPGSGKSTFLYQCLGNYQKDFPNGVGVVYDMESSSDNERLKVLGVDPDRLLRLPSTSLEDAFANMFKMLNKIEKLVEQYPDISSFQIYDSISSGGTEKQHAAANKGDSVFGAGTMMEAPRIIKQNLANVLPYMEKFPVFIGLINQVFTQVGMYVSKSESGGGFGLKHLCHAHISFGNNKDNYEKGFLVGTESMVQLKKSKLSPKFVDIPCYIDVTKGGVIDEVESFVKYLINPNVGMIITGSWYKFSDYIKTTIFEKFPVLSDHTELQSIINKTYRKDDIYDMVKSNSDICNLLQVALIEYIDDIYPAQREINQAYCDKLKDDCKYFRPIETISDKLTDLAPDIMNKDNDNI